MYGRFCRRHIRRLLIAVGLSNNLIFWEVFGWGQFLTKECAEVSAQLLAQALRADAEAVSNPQVRIIVVFGLYDVPLFLPLTPVHLRLMLSCYVSGICLLGLMTLDSTYCNKAFIQNGSVQEIVPQSHKEKALVSSGMRNILWRWYMQPRTLLR